MRIMPACIKAPCRKIDSPDKGHGIVDHHHLLMLRRANGMLVIEGIEGPFVGQPVEPQARNEFAIKLVKQGRIPVQHVDAQLPAPFEKIIEKRAKLVGNAGHGVVGIFERDAAIDIPSDNEDRTLRRQGRLLEGAEIVLPINQTGDLIGFGHAPAIHALAKRVLPRHGLCRSLACPKPIRQSPVCHASRILASRTRSGVTGSSICEDALEFGALLRGQISLDHRCAVAAPADGEEQAKRARAQNEDGRPPKQHRIGVEGRAEQHEIPVTCHHEGLDLVIRVTFEQPLPHQNAQVPRQRRIRIVDRLVLTDKATQIGREGPRALLQFGIVKYFVRLRRSQGRRRHAPNGEHEAGCECQGNGKAFHAHLLIPQGPEPGPAAALHAWPVQAPRPGNDDPSWRYPRRAP